VEGARAEQYLIDLADGAPGAFLVVCSAAVSAERYSWSSTMPMLTHSRVRKQPMAASSGNSDSLLNRRRLPPNSVRNFRVSNAIAAQRAYIHAVRRERPEGRLP
jgi:hypothetical protein